jgi:hypothetical protein
MDTFDADTLKTLRNNIYNIAYKYNTSNYNSNIRSLIQHVIYYLKTPQELEVLNDCLKVVEYIIYNIETNYARPAYSLTDTYNSVMMLQNLSRNTISTAWAAYLEKCCKYTYTSFREYLVGNITARCTRTLKSGVADVGCSNRRVIYDTDDYKYNTTSTTSSASTSSASTSSVTTSTARTDDIDNGYEGNDECESESDKQDSHDIITLCVSPPPTYNEDKDWMEVYYKYKKYNKLYEYMHKHIDSIAYDNEARLNYTTLLTSINRDIYNFASFLPEQSPYYKPLSF